MMIMGNTLGNLGSSLAGLLFIWATIQRVFPNHLKIAVKHFLLSTIQQFSFVQRFSDHYTNLFSPYVEIIFPQFQGFQYNHAFAAISVYLTSKGTDKTNRLIATHVRESESLLLKRDDVTISDEYEGFKVWWNIVVNADGDRAYKLTFHTQARSVITTSYIQHVVKTGKLEMAKSKKMKLFTNNPSPQNMWRCIEFEHPASFQTLAMDPQKKEAIMNDLIAFSNAKEYYKKIGKAWKRGYLLHGPPGTGKSTMIAAMANLLKYNIYDIELTSIQNNSHLKKLLTSTSNKSLIVIEDIDCAVDFTSNRVRTNGNEEINNKEKGKDENKVTLSGLLNFIDGIWSACGQERIIVFTTNHLQKLDPALVRRGRMDVHIAMCYCNYEAFKILAKNYLDLDDDHDHPLFEKIKSLLQETTISPADVAENLMARNHIVDVDRSLNNLIQTLERMNSYQKRLRREHQEKIDSSKKPKLYKFFGSLFSKRWLSIIFFFTMILLSLPSLRFNVISPL